MKKLLLLTCCFLTASILFAQKKVVEGIVRDPLSGETLTGVTISEKGLTNGTTSDAVGHYSLTVNEGDAVLVVSFVGYTTLEIPVNNRPVIDIELQDATLNLNEIVVTALGLERQSKDLGYAVQRLSSDEVAAVKSANFTDNLAGKIAGVTVTQGATGVGSTSKIIVRGELRFPIITHFCGRWHSGQQ